MRFVAILDFRVAVQQDVNRRLLERLAAAGKVRPRDWKTGPYRSLTLLTNGTCVLERASVAALSRRLAAAPAGWRGGK